MVTFTFQTGTLQLNEEQARIVQEPIHQSLRILASAGSGKTTTITGRIAWLLQNGAHPSQIILLTFTHNAAQEMHHRLEGLIGAQRILCGTFHALSQQILRTHNSEALQDMYHVDELPLKALDFFKTTKGVAFIETLRWVFIDEYQDINDVQDQFIKALVPAPKALTIVGDDAQNIYSWRGSCVNYILDFHKRFANIKDFQLSTNYRSSAAIVAVANSIMRHIPTLPHKELMTAGPKCQEGSCPEVRYFSRTSEERDWVVDAAIAATGSTVILSKYNSVLYAYEAAFLKLGIRVRLMSDGAHIPSTDNPCRISLSTFHSAKGLEWDNVFLVRMNDEVFPQQKDEDGVLQERRLFYVAVTRARHNLTFTYSRNDRSLCRFVREIHRPLLVFRNLPRYDLSTLVSSHQHTSVSDWVRCLTGEDFRTIKHLRLMPGLLSDPQQGLVVVPYWWIERGMAAEFFDFVRAYWFSEMGARRPDSGGPWDRDAQRTIWTVKIAAEDAVLFEAERGLFESLATKFFGSTEPGEPPPQIQYVDVLTEIKRLRGTPPDQPTTIRIIQIIHKMRTALYNLRFASVSLTDLQFAPIRHTPPQESRCQLIEAWRAYTGNAATLLDTYLIGLCRSISEGRSGVLADLPGAKEFGKCRDFLQGLRDQIDVIHRAARPREILCRVQVSITDGVIAAADMLVGETAWFFVAGDQSSEIRRLDRLITVLLTAHALRVAGHSVNRVCIFQMITGSKMEWDLADWPAAKAGLLYSFVEARAGSIV